MKYFNQAFLSTLVLLLLSYSVQAQYFVEEEEQEQEEVESSLFIGGGLVVNDLGLGAAIEFSINDQFYAFGKLGLGGWGYKLGGGIIYYPRSTPFGPGLSVGYSYATGFEGLESNMEMDNGQFEDVILNLHGTGSFNFIYSYAWKLGQKAKFAINAGYAASLKKNPYELVDSANDLSPTSKQVMTILQPGGLIIGVNIMFKF